MVISIAPYVLFVAAVAASRLIEIGISRGRQRALADLGVARSPQPDARWIVLVHVGVLIGAVLEVWLLERPLLLVVAVPMIVVFVLSTLLRWWVIRTLEQHWNLQVMNSVALGIVTGGPFRWIRHPNYLAVFLEYLAIPLIHGAWITASAGTLAHFLVLRTRIGAEERMLMAYPAYRRAMGDKARFVPGIF